MISILITGASTGLGAKLYEFLSEKEVSLTVIGRNAPEKLRSRDEFLRIDLSTDFSWMYEVRKDVSKIIFISNAGMIEPINSNKKFSINEVKHNNNVNFISPFFIANALAKVTRDRKIPLHIINVSSGAANKPISGWAAYCASKAAIKIALECISREYVHITVDHIDPGVLDTKMQEKIRSSENKLPPEEREFTRLYKKRLLKKPEVAANEIVKLVEGYIV